MKQSTQRDDIVPADDEDLVAVIGKDGAPIYFAVPQTATHAEASRTAFEVKHGRPPTNEEIVLLGMIERNHNG